MNAPTSKAQDIPVSIALLGLLGVLGAPLYLNSPVALPIGRIRRYFCRFRT